MQHDWRIYSANFPRNSIIFCYHGLWPLNSIKFHRSMVEPLSLFVTVRPIDDIRNNMHTGSILDCSPHRIHSRAKRKIDVRRCNLDICLVTQSRWNIGFIYDIWCERDSAFHVVSFVSFSAKFATSHCTIRSVDHPPPPLTYITPSSPISLLSNGHTFPPVMI